MDFVNRINELQYIQKAINEKANVILIKHRSSSGITAFLKHCSKKIEKSTNIYIDLSQGELSTNIFQNLIKDKKHLKKLQHICDKKFGEKSESLLSVLLKNIPYAGETIAHLSERKVAMPIYNGCFESVYEEILPDFIEKIKGEDHFTLLIDNAINISDSCINFIQKLLQIQKLVIIIAVPNEDISYCAKIENAFATQRFTTIEFEVPNSNLVKLIAESHNIPCDKKFAEEVMVKSESNIHLIIYLISSNRQQTIELTLYQKYVIAILYILSSEITYTELFSYVIRCTEIINSSILKKEIQALVNAQVVIYNSESKRYTLGLRENKTVQECLSDLSIELSAKQAILERNCQMTLEHVDNNLLNILYNITSELNDNRILLVLRELLNRAIVCGCVIDESKFHLLKESSNTPYTDLPIIIYLTQQRKYQEALDLIEQHHLESVYQSIYGVLLNRCRRHKEAFVVLKESIEHEKDANVQAVLYAYLISNYVHNGDTKLAKQIFNEIPSDVKICPNYAYAIRNIATIFSPEEAVLYCENAIKIFKKSCDYFGSFTCQCNLYRFIAECKSPKIALNGLLRLYKNNFHLQQSNLHIVLNNIGICYIELNEIDHAIQILKGAKLIAKTNMPKLFITINHCMALLRIQKNEEALCGLENIKQEVIEFPVDRVRQRFFANYCLALYANNKNEELRSAIKDLACHIDRVNPLTTQDLVSFYQKKLNEEQLYSSNDFSKLFVPCYLEYWYANPLKLISSNNVSDSLTIHAGNNNIVYQALI